MSMFATPGAYDYTITVFSPDGRLFQVEYALETVKRGSTVIGIVSSEGTVLAAEERFTKLQDRSFNWKVFKIDEHVGAAISGLSSDGRILVDQARIYAQSNRLTYDEGIDVETLSERIGEINQLYTQNGGVRPFGVSIIFGGVDRTGPKIFKTDPSGSCVGYKAVSIGAGGDAVRDILENKYKEDLTLEQAILLTVECLTKVIEGEADSKNIKIAIIPVDTKIFRMLSKEEVDSYIKNETPYYKT